MAALEILQEIEQAGRTRYRARWGNRQVAAETPGQALDAIYEMGGQGDEGRTTVILLHRCGPDRFFSEREQTRLGELMSAFDDSHQGGALLSAAEETELEAMVEAELRASAERAAALAAESCR